MEKNILYQIVYSLNQDILNNINKAIAGVESVSDFINQFLEHLKFNENITIQSFINGNSIHIKILYPPTRREAECILDYVENVWHIETFDNNMEQGYLDDIGLTSWGEGDRIAKWIKKI